MSKASGVFKHTPTKQNYLYRFDNITANFSRGFPQHNSSNIIYDADGTKIEFREVIVNNDNIEDFRNAKLEFIKGFCKPEADKQIVVYRYKLDNYVRLDPRSNVFDFELMRSLTDKNDENMTIAHEKRHILNAGFGSRAILIRNFYEFVMLFAWDEVSALMAGDMHAIKSPDEKVILNSFSKSLHTFIRNMPAYSDAHADIVFDLASLRDENYDIELKDFDINDNCNSDAFNKLVSSYFTFGDTHCWTDSNIKKNTNEIHMIKDVYKGTLTNLKYYLRTGVRKR